MTSYKSTPEYGVNAISLQHAYDECKRIATHHENFPVGSILFPRRLRNHFFSVYAFSRVADDIADEGDIAAEERLRQLDDWGALLREAYTSATLNHPVFIALADTIRTFHLPVELFENLLSAFRQDITAKRYTTFADVLDYCTRSANPIGRLVLSLFDVCTPERAILSDAICTALQLTNFWQDVCADYAKGRIYIPREDMREFNLRDEDIAGKIFSPAFHDCMAFQVERTTELFREGARLIPLLNGRLRLEIQWVINGGNAALRKIKENEFDVLRKSNNLTAKDYALNFMNSLFMTIFSKGR